MIAVLGGTGRTGRVVARTLKAQGRHVRLVARTKARAERLEERGEDVAIASVDDEHALTAALAKTTALYALLPDDFTVGDFHAARRRAADAMARAVKRSGVGRVVLVSSAEAGVASEGLGADLAHLERAMLDTGAAVTILRASYFQDNALEAVPVARAEGVYPSFFPDRTRRIATVAARDAGAIAARALLGASDESEIIDVVGPSYSPIEIAAALSRALAKPVQVAEVPAAAQEGLFASWGMSPEGARAMAGTLATLGAGSIVHRGRRVERATTTLDETLREALGLESPQPEAAAR
jgi:NAD(P)H dehydrogenase (quinone)